MLADQRSSRLQSPLVHELRGLHLAVSLLRQLPVARWLCYSCSYSVSRLPCSCPLSGELEQSARKEGRDGRDGRPASLVDQPASSVAGRVHRTIQKENEPKLAGSTFVVACESHSGAAPIRWGSSLARSAGEEAGSWRSGEVLQLRSSKGLMGERLGAVALQKSDLKREGNTPLYERRQPCEKEEHGRP